MNIRIKIADFPSAVQLSAENCIAFTDSTEIVLPSIFSAQASSPAEILYCRRLFHLHTEPEIEPLLNSFPEEIRKELTVEYPGAKWDGRGISRYWITTRGFADETELAKYSNEILGNLPLKLSGRTQIEGGVFAKHLSNSDQQLIITATDGKIILQSPIIRLCAPKGVTVKNAPVGTTFHWEHTEDLTFNGILELRPGAEGLLVISEIPLEEYLASVNSSEMSAYAPLEFLKAQTIAARGTVAATMGCHHYGEPYDLCNGDHCQCYYGSGRLQARSQEAAELTAGMALTWRGIICDTRYAKTCGGVMETFNNVWEKYNPGYLKDRFDGDAQGYSIDDPAKYLKDKPDCWCNPEIHPYPDYFDYAKPWFRWKIDYDKYQLAEIAAGKTGKNITRIDKLVPFRRGKSGRITRLKVECEQPFEIFGELNIRRILSQTHLPSSCFLAYTTGDRMTILGAGWGHGVGLCQMGALNMAIAGKTTGEILAHYYPGGKLERFFV